MFAKGNRIVVVEDNGRNGLLGLEGVVDLVTQTGIVVILENDPAIKHRVNPDDSFFELNRPIVRRFFLLNQIKKIG